MSSKTILVTENTPKCGIDEFGVEVKDHDCVWVGHRGRKDLSRMLSKYEVASWIQWKRTF